MRTCTSADPLRLAVLLSGSGRTLENLIEAQRAGRLGPAAIVLAVSTKAEATGLRFASAAGVATAEVFRRSFPSDFAWSDAVTTVLSAARAEAVVLAGCIHRYLFPPEYSSKVLNIHPSLVPAFAGPGWYGGKSHEAAFERGVKVSGCTVHFATNEYDAGPIIHQVPVFVGDCADAHAIAGRVFEAECQAYPEAIRLFAEGRLTVEGQRVRVRRG